MPIIPKKTKFLNPARTIVLSFLAIIAVGTVLLMMPFSSRTGQFTKLIDALFTATSATCVTGLIVFDTYTHWNAFGQGVILAMIQIGGLGFVTFVSFFNFALGKKSGLRSMQVANESFSTDGFSDIRSLVPAIFKISLFCELIGAAALATVFVPKYGSSGVFMSIFTAVSAFCNAGFDICGRESQFISLTNYADNPVVMITVMLLIICGGLGFIVWADLIGFRKSKKLLLHTKVVLFSTAMLVVLGTVLFLLTEWDNPGTIGGMSFMQKLSRGLFQSVTFRTAGFNTVSMEDMHGITKLISMVLMFIGGASGSTAGGIKITTSVVVLMTVVSVIMNKDDTEILGRRIDKDVVYKSLAIINMAAFAVAVSSVLIFYTNTDSGISGIDAAFESVSAFATVGVSVGTTAKMNNLSKILVAFIMFLGRVGPVSMGLSLTASNVRRSKQIVPEGKIIVG